MMQVTDLSWWVETQHSAMESALKQLVEINTFTPNTDGVDAGMDMISSLAEDLGFTVQTINARHRLIIAEKEGADGELPPRILLIAHMDTVHAPDEGFLQYEPLGEGFIKGPGTGDIKGGLVMGLWAMKAATEILDAYNLHLVISADEERGSPTIRDWYWNRDEHQAAYGIGLEPGFPQAELSADVDLGVVYQRRGYASIRFTIQGKSAHSGTPELGLSAIEAMAHRITKLHALNDRERNISVNVGLVHGGTAPNTVPGEAEATVSFRYETQADGIEVRSAIEKIISEPVVSNDELGIQETSVYHVDTFIPPMEHTDANQKLVDIVIKESKRLQQPVVPIMRRGGSDANHVSASGVPCICGMGAPAQDIHTKNEKIYLPMMFERVNLLAATLCRVTQERP